jgi:flagellar FliJ protein
MKRFRFPLDKVLAYRRQMEAERRRALAVALKVLRRREEELAQLAGEMGSYRTRLAEMGTGRLAARDLALYRSYLSYLEAKVAQASQWTRDARGAVEGRRAELVESSRDRKVLEKVESHARAAHDYEASREETKDLDEIGTVKHLAQRVEAAQEVVV